TDAARASPRVGVLEIATGGEAAQELERRIEPLGDALQEDAGADERRDDPPEAGRSGIRGRARAVARDESRPGGARHRPAMERPAEVEAGGPDLELLVVDEVQATAAVDQHVLGAEVLVDQRDPRRLGIERRERGAESGGFRGREGARPAQDLE